MIEAGPSPGPVCVCRGRRYSSLNISCVLVESCKECSNCSLAQPVELKGDMAAVPSAQQALGKAGRVLPASLSSQLAVSSSSHPVFVTDAFGDLLAVVGGVEVAAPGGKVLSGKVVGRRWWLFVLCLNSCGCGRIPQ